MDDKEIDLSEEELLILREYLETLKKRIANKSTETNEIDKQIIKLESAIKKINARKHTLIDNNLTRRQNIYKKINQIAMFTIGLGSIIGIILFGIITKEIGIMLEYLSLSCTLISVTMIIKLVMEMAIDAYKTEKLMKTKEYKDIEDVSIRVEKVLEILKEKKDILAQTRGIEVDAYNDKVQKLYEEGCAPADTEGKIDAMTALLEEITKNKKPKTRKRKIRKENKNTGDI